MIARSISRPVLALVLCALLASPAAAAAHEPPPVTEITATRAGRELAAAAAERRAAAGQPVPASSLRVWRLAAGDYFIAERLPENFSTTVRSWPDGRTSLDVSFDIGGRVPSAEAALELQAAATVPTWGWLNSGCFDRRNNAYGWIDPCFSIHGLFGESDPRDFIKLEHWATMGAFPLSKMYDGWVGATKGSNSSPMSWIDWSPRSSRSGSCQVVGLSVTALGVSITSSGIMCENWIITKGSAAGSFKQQWSCGCIYPFGQPYPNTREVDYMQAVSVPNGGYASWMLTTGWLAH